MVEWLKEYSVNSFWLVQEIMPFSSWILHMVPLLKCNQGCMSQPKKPCLHSQPISMDSV